MNCRSLWDQWYHGSHCLSPAISDNLGVMCRGDLWPTRFERYKLKTFLKGSQPFLSGVPSATDKDAQSALKVQQNQISHTQSSPTENNIFDFSHKATFLFPKKTFQWVLLRIWNKGRIFLFTLQIQLQWSWGRNQSQAWLHVFQHRSSFMLHLHHCLPYRDITALGLPTFSPHPQQLINQSHGEIFWKS